MQEVSLEERWQMDDDHGFADHRRSQTEEEEEEEGDAEEGMSSSSRHSSMGSMLDDYDGSAGKSFLAECEDMDEHLMVLPMEEEIKVEEQQQIDDEQQQQPHQQLVLANQAQEAQELQPQEVEMSSVGVEGDQPRHEHHQYDHHHVVDQQQEVLSCGSNLEEFRSKRYYLFNAGAHDLMIASLLDSTNPSAAEISAADPTFQPLPWQNKRGITVTSAIEDRWRDFKAKLGVKIDATGKRFLFHKRDASRYIPHTGQWLEIVKTCHVDAAARHWGRNLTKHQITKRWMYGERNHGIPETFVDAFIDSCGCCRREQLPPPVVAVPPSSLQSKKRKLGKKLSTSLFGVHFIRQKIDEIVAAANFEQGASLKHVRSLEDGTSSSDFEKLNEEEQLKLKEKLTAIRNEMDSTLVHLPSMSRGRLFNSLQAIDGMITDLKSPALDKHHHHHHAFASKLPVVEHNKHPSQPRKVKADFQEPPKPTKKVKWKDLARSPQHKDFDGTS